MAVNWTKTYESEDDLTFVLNGLRFACSEGNRSFFVYGGVPRDLLRNDKFHDIDVYVQDKRNVKNFCTFLKRADRLRAESHNQRGGNNQYSSTILDVQTSRSDHLQVDITSHHKSFIGGLCDFTCNNLVLTSDGNITTRVPPPPNVPSAMWTLTCIRDAIEGKLCWMIPDKAVKHLTPKSYNEFRNKMDERYQKMIAKGFGPRCSTLSAFSCQELKRYTPSPSCLCAICKEEYSETCAKDRVLLHCNHHFHTECIDSWVSSGRYHSTCPICRETIQLRFEQTDSQGAA